MEMLVLSTGFRAPTRDRCIWSVAKQSHPHIHEYIEASEQTPLRTVTENVWTACQNLDPDTVVAWLDGDDWLATDDALSHVASMHDAGAIVTYGNFTFNDGRPSGLRAYQDPAKCRQEPWLGSHLKTWRAGLMQRVKPEDLQIDGKWIEVACDIALMFPLLEMSGPRAVFCPKVLCVYNYASSWEFRDPGVRVREREVVKELRSRAPRSILSL